MEQTVSIDIIFSKQGQLRFISHLDLLRLFSRACRRARLPVVLSKGYSPKLKIKIKRALKLGIESRNEEAEFLTDGSVSLLEFRTRKYDPLSRYFPLYDFNDIPDLGIGGFKLFPSVPFISCKKVLFFLAVSWLVFPFCTHGISPLARISR